MITMKYDFKVDQVIMDLEHSARRFVEEKCPGSTPVIDITSDPRSVVAAHLLNKIFPANACAVYVEDRVRDRVDEDIIKTIENLFGDRFVKIEENECEPYRNCLDNFTSKSPIKQINNHLLIKFLYLSSKLDEKNPVIFDYHDFVQVKCGLVVKCTPGLFTMLTYQEIMLVAKKLGIDLDMLDRSYDQSDIIKEHENIIGYNIREFSEDLRSSAEKQSMFATLVNKYAEPINYTVDHPITVSTKSMYNMYNEDK